MKTLIQQQQEVVSKIDNYISLESNEDTISMLELAKAEAMKALDTLEYINLNY